MTKTSRIKKETNQNNDRKKNIHWTLKSLKNQNLNIYKQNQKDKPVEYTFNIIQHPII